MLLYVYCCIYLLFTLIFLNSTFIKNVCTQFTKIIFKNRKCILYIGMPIDLDRLNNALLLIDLANALLCHSY